MSIYENVKENITIAIFSLQNNILDVVANKLENKEFKVETYNDIEILKKDIKNGKIGISIIYGYNNQIEEELKEIENVIFLEYNDTTKKSININDTEFKNLYKELRKCIYNIANKEKIKFQNFKLDILSNLVESVSHKIQSDILLAGACFDIIKMLSEDEKTNKNNEKKELINTLYNRNSKSLQDANTLLDIMSNATNISSESIMQCDTIIAIINQILYETIKENLATLDISKKIKENTYICGPLNDIIFIICKIIIKLIEDGNKYIKLYIREDDIKWYFEIIVENKFKNKKGLEKVAENVLYVTGLTSKILENRMWIEVKKIY